MRATDDIDVTIEPKRTSNAKIAAAFEAAGFTLVWNDPAFIEQSRVFRLRDVNGVNVDLVLGGAGYDAIVLSRVVRRKLGGVFVPVAAPEDIIVMKVLASREPSIRATCSPRSSHC